MNYEDHPVYWVTEWLAAEMRADDIIPGEDDYMTDLSDREGQNFVVPFFTPAQQSIEATNMYDEDEFKSLPFASYQATITYDPSMPYMECGEVGFVLYSQNIDGLFRIVRYLSKLAGRGHWSAADLNRWAANQNRYCSFDFKNIEVDTATGPVETTDEGGRHSFVMQINYDAVDEGSGRKDDEISQAPFAFPFSDVGMRNLP